MRVLIRAELLESASDELPMIVLFNCKDFRKVTKVAEDFGPKLRASTSNLPKRASPFLGMRVLVGTELGRVCVRRRVNTLALSVAR